jgi:dTDP-3-amino-3,4,6-trideoxy-alpha-D-glucose transaminase
MPNVPFGDLKRQTASLQPDLEAAIHRVLASGWYILGQEVATLEEEFAAFCGARYAIGVANGTEALQLALVACGIGPGDEVITVPNAGVPGTAAILLTGARPAFADVSIDSHNLDPDRLEGAITPRTRAVMLVHLYGRTAALEPIIEIARRHGIYVVEDCAQAHGARYHGTIVGTFGDVGCFSFYPTKNLGACGDGGLVITNDYDIAARLRRLRVYGWGRKYHSDLPGGTNSRLDELQAAILRVKLPHLDEWNRARQERAHRYSELLAGGPVLPPETPPPGEEHVYHLYVVRSPHRQALQSHLRAQGIGTDIHYPLPTHLQPIYRGLGYHEGDFPVSEQLAREVLSLPMYPELTPEEVAAVAATVRAFVPPKEQP